MKETKKSQKTKLLIILSMIMMIVIISIISPYIAPHDPYKTDLLNVLQKPSKEYILGTDSLGRCVFSRVLYGGATTIFSSVILVMITFLIGSIIGIFSGYIGGRFDEFIMRIVDIFLAFPDLVIAIAVAGILGGGIINAMIAIGVISWTKYARLARSEVLTLKEETFIQAAKLSGNSSIHIIRKYIIPNVLGNLIIAAALDMGAMIMNLAGLSFLGLSTPLPIPEWGSMMSEGRSMIQFAPWIAIYPGIAIFIVVVLFNLLGETIRDLLSR